MVARLAGSLLWFEAAGLAAAAPWLLRMGSFLRTGALVCSAADLVVGAALLEAAARRRQEGWLTGLVIAALVVGFAPAGYVLLLSMNSVRR
ncbi:MAG: hypothetical protein U0228_20930 [Myxococcaceae bacterium]